MPLFLVPVDGKNSRTKFEIEKENTKLQIARKLPLYPLFFLQYSDSSLKKTKEISLFLSKTLKLSNLQRLFFVEITEPVIAINY